MNHQASMKYAVQFGSIEEARAAITKRTAENTLFLQHARRYFDTFRQQGQVHVGFSQPAHVLIFGDAEPHGGAYLDVTAIQYRGYRSTPSMSAEVLDGLKHLVDHELTVGSLGSVLKYGATLPKDGGGAETVAVDVTMDYVNALDFSEGVLYFDVGIATDEN